jgi:hypothetical protein
VGQQTRHEPDRRTALLAAFDSMTDEAQLDSLAMLQALAISLPRRIPAALRLVASGGNSLQLGKSSRRDQ